MRPKTEPPGNEDSTEEVEPDVPALDAPDRAARRRIAFAVWRALVVLLLGAVSYALVVPYSHIDRSTMGALIIANPPLPKYTAKSAGPAGPQVVSQSGLPVMKTAAKHDPDRTGLYSKIWQVSETNALGVIVGLLPTSAGATSAAKEEVDSQLGPNAFSSDNPPLTQSAQFVIPSIPGSHGALFVPGAGAAPGSLAVVVFSYGRTWSAVDLLYTADGQANVTKLAKAELAQLKQAAPGFTLRPEVYPVLETSLWGAGTLAIAAVAGLGPPARRSLRQRREEKRQRELASRVVVKGQTIQKRRRT